MSNSLGEELDHGGGGHVKRIERVDDQLVELQVPQELHVIVHDQVLDTRNQMPIIFTNRQTKKITQTHKHAHRGKIDKVK